MKKYGAYAAVVFIIAVGITVLVSSAKQQLNPQRSLTDEMITIGYIGPLTGEAATIGTINKAAIELAVDEINAKGGVKGRQLLVIYEDGKCSSAAVSAAQKLMTLDKVSIIIGECSPEIASFGPTAMQNKVLVISPLASAPKLSSLGPYFFRTYPSDSNQGKFAAEYAYNNLNARTAAILYHKNDWGAGIEEVFKKRFQELGGSILVDDGYASEARDYRTSLTKIASAKSDMAFMPLFPEGGRLAVKQAQELGISAPILGADAWDEPGFQKEAAYAGTLLFTAPTTPIPDEFKAKMAAKTGRNEIPVGTTQSYDTVYLLAEAIKNVGLDATKIAKELHRITYNGIIGPISFDKNGDITTAQYVVSQIKNGNAVKVK